MFVFAIIARGMLISNPIIMGIIDISIMIDRTTPKINSSPVYPFVMVMLAFIESIGPHVLSIRK